MKRTSIAVISLLVLVLLFLSLWFFTRPPKIEKIGDDGRFSAYSNGTVLDTETGLMWAAKDNGEYITWKDAKAYCENYKGGDYKDWRMPTQDELSKIYQSDRLNRHGYRVTNLIEVTGCCIWASDESGALAAYLRFYDGDRLWSPQSNSYSANVLPVRLNK